MSAYPNGGHVRPLDTPWSNDEIRNASRGGEAYVSSDKPPGLPGGRADWYGSNTQIFNPADNPTTLAAVGGTQNWALGSQFRPRTG